MNILTFGRRVYCQYIGANSLDSMFGRRRKCFFTSSARSPFTFSVPMRPLGGGNVEELAARA